MKRSLYGIAVLLCAAGTALAGTAVQAQGVTTSAIAGRVTNVQGEGVPGIQVVATNTSTGADFRVVTRSDGRYLVSGLQPGGPYRIEARGVGYAAQARTGVNLALSQTAQFDFTLVQEAVALDALTVTAEARDAVISRGRTGTATVVSDSAIARLPTLTRDFTDFVRLTPQISTGVSGTSAGGRNNRFNSIQIDGAVNNDLFGLAASGTPGGQAGARPITLEAIQEFQVVIAPFDVRQGGFTGAGINAITKSGSNDFRGSLAYVGRNQDFVGRYKLPGDTLSGPVSEFNQNDLAFSLGGPIMRDRLFFFIAGERSGRSAPLNAVAGTATADVTAEQAQEIATYLQETFGYDPGAFGPLSLDQGSTNFVGRIDFSISDNHRLTLRHNFVDAEDENLGRSSRSYGLGSAGYDFTSRTNSSVAQLNSSFGRGLFNELRLGYTTIRDKRVITQPFPRIFVESPTGTVIAGPDNFSGRNALDQNVVELTNDLTIPFGSHTLVIGTNNEFFDFSNLFVRNPFGNYTFASMAALRAGTPRFYENSYLLPGGDERAEFPVRRFSLYAQDQWDIADNFRLTGGIRYDVTQLPNNPKDNPVVFTAVGRRTSDVPSGKGLLNPRIGFNWDVAGDRFTQLRGGLGLFSGRTPFVWISNAYGNTGLDYVRFTCTTAATAPRFVGDAFNQPRNCGGSGATALAPNEINTVDPDFKQPQVFRGSLALDRRLGLGFTGTLEGLFTKTVHDVLYRNLGVEEVPGGVREGRPQYTARNLRSFGIGDVIDVTNTGEGYTYSLTTQVQRPFQNGWDMSAAYTFSRATDINALGSSQAISNWRFTPTRSNPNDPELATSRFEVPHRFLLFGTYQAKLIRRAPTDVSLIYVGESGRAYSYIYGSDVNGDGSFGNDLVRVPENQSDIRFASGTVRGQVITPEQSQKNLNDFIEQVSCLREARGTVIERNTCREPWSNRLDVRLAQTVPTVRGQGAQITVDILNFANLLNRDWGRSEFVSFQTDNLLRTTSSSPGSDGRFTYQAFAPREDVFSISNLASRYQIQLGLRYNF
ncbi:MAG: TonB-dependent receptor [Gemmatimonadota bacterium]|nr:TonB-dependent receptor [Gemmatimonadota bacterium]